MQICVFQQNYRKNVMGFFKIRFSILLLLLMSQPLHSTYVVFLQGTSRSGKSSLCSQIELYENWDVVGSVYFSYCLSVFNEFFPAQFACIKEGIEDENIRHAVTRNLFMFKKDVNEDLKQEIRNAAQKIQNYFNDPLIYACHKQDFSNFSLNEIARRIKNGMNVVADVSWYVPQESIQNICPTPTIFTALVYCPFPLVIDRLCERNKKDLDTDSIMNYRFFIEPLTSFISLYDLCAENYGAIDIIEKTTFFACLDIIESHLSHNAIEIHANSGFMMQELSQSQLNEFRAQFLKIFGNNKSLYVVPKLPYDLVLKTNEYTSQECAEQIIAYVLDQEYRA